MSSAPPCPVAPLLRLSLNGSVIELARCSLSQLVIDRQLIGKRIAIERNGEIVPKSQHAKTFIEDGDQLEIVVAVGGG